MIRNIWRAIYPFVVYIPDLQTSGKENRKAELTIWRPGILWGGLSGTAGLDWLGGSRHAMDWLKSSQPDVQWFYEHILSPSPIWGASEISPWTNLILNLAIPSGKTPSVEDIVNEWGPDSLQIAEIHRRILLGWVFLMAEKNDFRAIWHGDWLEIEHSPEWVPPIPILPEIRIVGETVAPMGNESDAFRVFPHPFVPRVEINPLYAPEPMGFFRILKEKDKGVLVVEIGREVWAILHDKQPQSPRGLVGIRDRSGKNWMVWGFAETSNVPQVREGTHVLGLILIDIECDEGARVLHEEGALALIEGSTQVFPADEAAVILLESSGIHLDDLSNEILSTVQKTRKDRFTWKISKNKNLHIYACIPPVSDAEDFTSMAYREIKRRIFLTKLANHARHFGILARGTPHGIRIGRLPVPGLLLRFASFIETSRGKRNAYNPWNQCGVFDVSLREKLPASWSKRWGEWWAVRINEHNAVVIPSVDSFYPIAMGAGSPGAEENR